VGLPPKGLVGTALPGKWLELVEPKGVQVFPLGQNRHKGREKNRGSSGVYAMTQPVEAICPVVTALGRKNQVIGTTTQVPGPKSEGKNPRKKS